MKKTRSTHLCNGMSVRDVRIEYAHAIVEFYDDSVLIIGATKDWRGYPMITTLGRNELEPEHAARLGLQTDEEFAAERKAKEEARAQQRDDRFSQYLQLKAEFEGVA